MIRCLVTDRHRLAGPTSSFDMQRDALREQFLRAVDDRIDLIQIRERDLAAADLAAIVDAAVRASRGSLTRILVNDRLDVALACGADGVHLRSDSFAASRARRITPPGFLIARAVHTPDEAGLEAIVGAATAPVLAIGGITADRFEEILRTGAAGVAGIGLFLPTALPFDSPGTSP